MEEFKIEWVDISTVKPYWNNPRYNDEGVDATANSIKEFGWQQPIVVDREGVIIAGHTRYKAALKLGLKKVPVKFAADLSEEQATAYRIADNKTADLSDWDFTKLGAEIEALESTDMTLFGFTQTDIDAFKAPSPLDDLMGDQEEEAEEKDGPKAKRVIITYKTEAERVWLERLLHLDGPIKDSYQFADILVNMEADN